MLQPLDGPSLQYKVSVTTGVVRKIEQVIGNGALEDRKVITIQPLDGRIQVYFGDQTAPTAGVVSSDGFVQYKRSIQSYEASASQDVYIVASSGTVDVVISERA